MTEKSGLWDGSALGDCGPYGMSDVHDWLFRMVLNGTGNQGPLKWWLNGLEVTGTSSPVSVATGAAIIYGLFYESDSATSVNVSTPSAGNSRYDRIVVRRDWSTYTARIASVTGVAAAAPAVPALTQTAGAIYEIPLATVLVDDTGTITVTDTREYSTFCTEWPLNLIDTEHYVAGAVTPAKVPNRTRYDLKDAGSMEPDSTTPAAWTAGASYDYWVMADAVTDAVWVYFMAPTGLVGSQVDIYVWSVPDVNGAGGGAENVDWNYYAYHGDSGGTLTSSTGGPVQYDQAARVNTTVYADSLISALAVTEGDIILLKIERAGAADSYNSDIRLIGAEMRWTADA